MKSIVTLLAIVMAVTPAFAADSEVEQLRAEVQALRQMVVQLTERLDKLEGNTDKTPPSIQTSPIATTKKNSPFYDYFDYSLSNITPPRRLLKQHTFEVKSVEVKYAKLTSNYILTFELAVQNYANEEWAPRADKYVLMLKDTDIEGDVINGSRLTKRQRDTIHVVFKQKEFKPQDAKLTIESKDPSNIGNTEFRMTIIGQ